MPYQCCMLLITKKNQYSVYQIGDSRKSTNDEKAQAMKKQK